MTQTQTNGTHNITELNLAHFYGSENLYRYGFLCRRLILTEGAMFISQNGAGWLIDVIASYQHEARLRGNEQLQDFQLWELKVKDGKGVVTCRADSNVPPVITQKMDTDFPLDSIKFYVENSGEGMLTCMLPSER